MDLLPITWGESDKLLKRNMILSIVLQRTEGLLVCSLK